MTAKTEPFLGGIYGYDFGESGWNVGIDADILKFSYMLNGVYHAFEINDSNAASYANGQAYWNTSDLTINVKVDGTTRKYTVPKGYILTSSDGSVKWEFNGTALVQAMNASDKVKLNGIATGATANLNNATLLDRANHTGMQSTTTISGLEPRLSGVETGKLPVNNPSVTGNLSILGGSSRILGNFSNSTPGDNTVFKTGTVNGPTIIAAIPDGTATSAGFNAWNSSDPNNASRLGALASNTECQIRSDKSGSGSYIPLVLYTGGTQKMWIGPGPSSGIGIGTSSPVELLHVAGAIKADSRVVTTGLSLTNTPTANATILDYYEEGSFTPRIDGGISAGTGTYSEQSGRYTRIGDRVDFVLNIIWTAHTGTGAITIVGFPYTAQNVTTPLSLHCEGLNFTDSKNLSATISGSGVTRVLIYQLNSDSSPTALSIDSSGYISVSGTYWVP